MIKKAINICPHLRCGYRRFVTLLGVVSVSISSPLTLASEIVMPEVSTATVETSAELDNRTLTQAQESVRLPTVVPQAESVDLSEPVEQPEKLSTNDVIKLDSGLLSPAELEVKPVDSLAAGSADEEISPEPLVILGAEVLPGTATRLSWKPDQSFEGIAAPTPVLVVNGKRAGPTLCLTAAIHGDELNGIEIVRRVLYEADPEKLSGTLIGVPIVNLHGFHRTSRYLPDRRDLNRFFPGNPRGSSASRIAYSFFNEIILRCDALVDLHTGSFRRTNLPQVRADLTNAAIVDLSQSFGATVVLHNVGTEGTLRRAAANAGIPTITLEAGEPMRLQQAAVNHGVKGIETLLNKMAMYKRVSFWGDPEPVFYRSRWIRADQGGILFSEVELGESVNIGELLGIVTDPITNVRTEIQSPFKGRVLGRALDQVVMPGFAAFRIGIETSERDIQEQSTEEEDMLEGQDESEIEAAKIMQKARAIDAIQGAGEDESPEISE
ncbi:MAG: succinylglutamate desuccinylase/aspartoacylase family protein [Porticoccaceae bacterium]|nr:succinylglutamate desuccinylase/aspartoacylase family protein [Porticoccaceae bacterium]